MAVEILCMAQSNAPHSDPEVDRRAVHKKGDIVGMTDTFSFTGHGPFVALRNASLALDQVISRLDPWVWNLNFAVIANDPAIDGWRLQATNATQSASGEASLTRARVEEFLTRWGATVVAFTGNSVTFDVRIFDAATSVGFWGHFPASVTFLETAYDQATGLHTIEVDYSALPAYQEAPVEIRKQVKSRIEGNGGVWLLHTVDGVTVFQITRAAVREQFRQEVSERLGIWRRRRWRVLPSVIDQAIAAGGILNMTVNNLTNAFVDRWAE